MPKTISMEGKATIHQAVQFRQICLEAKESNDPTVEINWSGSVAIDTCVLQLLLALSREKQLSGVGEPGEAVREALALAGFDSNLKPTSSPG